MGELVLFSLRNRFYNKATVVLNIILFFVISLLFSVDLIIKAGDPSFFEKPLLNISMEIRELFPNIEEKLQKEYTIIEQEDEEIRMLLLKNGHWQLQYHEEIENLEVSRLEKILEETLTQYRNSTLSISFQNKYQPYFDNKVVVESMIESENTSDKEVSVFVIITSIYFMMLSYSAMIANEVVHEKTSRVLELILTSVSTRVHLLSKMIISWLTIIIQAGLVLGYFSLCASMRFLYDYGSGTMQFFSKVGLIPSEIKNFVFIFYYYPITQEMIHSLIWALLFLFTGILFVQLLLVILSSYVKSVEESASIQGPFYFFLLFVYYFVLSINNPTQLSTGIGFVGSFIPFFSMLLMPARLMMVKVLWIEKLISLLLAISALVLTVVKGEKYYKRGILGGSLKKTKTKS